MTDPRDPNFPHVFPIAQRFMKEAGASTVLILAEFDERAARILSGVNESHAPWQEALRIATKPEPKVIVPKGYIPLKA